MAMDRTNKGGCIRCPPCRLGKGISRLSIIPQKMLNRTRHLSEPTRSIEEIHLVVLIANLIGQAASPRLDLVELVLLLIVSRFADVYSLVFRKAARPSLAVPRYEHDKAPVYNFLDSVVAILARLDDFTSKEVFFKTMDRLLWSIIPTRIHPLLPGIVFPCPIDLGHNGLGQVIRIGDMNPVA